MHIPVPGREGRGMWSTPQPGLLAACGVLVQTDHSSAVSGSNALLWSGLCLNSQHIHVSQQESKGAQDGSHSLFYNLTLEVAYDHFFQILLVTEPNTGAVSEEIAHWGSS